MRDGTLISEIVIFHSIFRKLFTSILQGSVSSVASGVNLFRTKVVGEQTPTFLRTDFIAGRSMLPDFFAAVREREFC